MENFVDLYTDYLLSSSSYTTATGMAALLQMKHDRITRSLSRGDYDSKFLWRYAKPYVQELTRSGGTAVLSFGDSIQEKPYTDESELIREMLRECSGKMHFNYVLGDSWFSSVDNMLCCKGELGVDFIMALKSNRKVALSSQDKANKECTGIGSLQPGRRTVEIWLEELDFPLLLVRQVFKNGDGTVGELYLACSGLDLGYDRITTIYKRRWGVEEYHKSIKCNAGSAKSPTKTTKTQTNDFVLSIVAYIKLEWLKQRTGENHFAMKSQIYMAAQKTAYAELQKLSTPMPLNTAKRA